MLDLLAADFLAKVSSVATLENTTSFTIGGKTEDPTLKDIPIPAARLLYLSDTPGEDPFTQGTARGGALVPGTQAQLATFGALIIVPYLDVPDYLGVELPLLEAVMRALHGEDSPSGHRWRYYSTHKDFIFPTRMAFFQRYTVDWLL